MEPEVEPTPEVVVEITAPEGGEQQQEIIPVETPSGINPAWEPLRNELDPISFSRIERHLREMDNAGQQRFTKLNEDFKWAKELQDQGWTPDRVSSAIQFATNLDDNPEIIYQQLGQFLQENGRMPADEQELLESVDGNEAEAEVLDEDPRFKQLSDKQKSLEDQQQRIDDFFAQQEEQRQAQVIETQLTSELSALEESRKDLTRPDIAEILRYAGSQTEANRVSGVDKIVSIAEATQWFDSLKNRFLSAPRPGDSAPQLLPTSGGVPTGQTQKRPSEYTSAEVQALIAGGIQSSKQQ